MNEDDSVVVPSSMVGRIIGQQGATIKRLQETYGVTIAIPDKNTTSTQEHVEIKVNPSAQGADVGGALAEITGICGGSSASQNTIAIFLFRKEPTSKRVQLLLQFRGLWAVPSRRAPLSTDINSVASAIFLEQLGDPPFEELYPLDPVELPGRHFFHLCVPPTEIWDAWKPGIETPSAAIEPVLQVDAATSYAGENQMIWIHLEVLEAFCATASAGASLNKLLISWVQHNKDLFAKVYGTYQLEPPAPVVLTDNWVTTDEGRNLAGNFQHIAKYLVTLSDDEFLQCLQAIGNPSHIRDMIANWRSGGGDLPFENS